MPKSVDEAAKEYRRVQQDFHDSDGVDVEETFLAGAEWMRKQFALWGTDDCIEHKCDGRCTMYVTMEGRCLECANKRELSGPAGGSNG